MHTPHLISPPTAFARLTRSPAKLMALGHAPKSESPHGVRLVQLRRAEVDAFCACDQTHVYSTGRTAFPEQSVCISSLVVASLPTQGSCWCCMPQGRTGRTACASACTAVMRKPSLHSPSQGLCPPVCWCAKPPAVTTIAVAASTRKPPPHPLLSASRSTCAAVTGSCAQAAALLTIAGAVSVCARSAYAAVTGRCAQAATLLITIGAASVRVGRCAQVAASPTIVGIFAHQRNHRDRVRAMRRCAKRVHHGHAPIVTSLIPGVASVHAAWCKPSPGSRPCYI
ncbi:hypothetical protein B0H14DRAFT_3447414 [Mycena olivaceomarginata]|nr:hypothetical protein B0H14DRAFT_3447414 [Mycena olivaceomarginata]